MAGFFVFFALLAGYWVAASLFIAAMVKPFAPDRVGLLRLPGGGMSLHLGFIARPPAGSAERLGFRIVPLGLLAGGLVYGVTVRLVREVVRRLRRRPFAAAGRRRGA